MYARFVDYYDLMHAGLTADRDFLLALASETGDPILELGCGSGRLLLPLAAAGFTITGIDNNAAMLARAQERLLQASPAVQSRVKLIEADMLEWEGENGRFSLIILPYNTLMHLEPRDAKSLFSRVQGWLGENGRFVIDLENPFAVESLLPESDFTLEDTFIDPQSEEKIEQFSRTQLDANRQILDVSWVFVTEKEHIRVDMQYHYRFPHELELALSQAGLQLVQLWGEYGRSAFSEESPRLIILARKF